jgi:high-affinity iron transporter
MLPTFVIGLREGLEAALIVSIVASFLRQRGRFDLLRWVWIGIGAAVVLCLGVGIALDVISKNLPQKQQEGLETVIGGVAVLMVTYMVIWMRRHSRDLKGQLEGATAEALAAGSGFALVAMAFLAVLREGFETAVFLLAAFNESDNPTTAGAGAVLGIALAVVLGYLIYRGGVKLNLSKFFRATGVVLVLVAAGLVVSALHTAHEAGWLNSGQQRLLDLTAVVRPGSVQSSLLTGILGIQERPTVIETIGWLVYLIPLGLYVGWPPGRALSTALQRRLAAGAAAVCVVGGVLCLALAPSAGPASPISVFGSDSAQVLSVSGDKAQISSTVRSPAATGDSGSAARQQVEASRTGVESREGTSLDIYTASAAGRSAAGRPATLTLAQVAELNGGRLPLGAATNASTSDPVAMSYADTVALTWWVEPETRRVVDVRWSETLTRTAALTIGPTVVGSADPVVSAVDPAQAGAALAQAKSAESRLDDRRTVIGAGIALLAAAAAAGLWLGLLLRRRRSVSKTAGEPARQLIES